jgi:hypothetical protein
MEENGEQVAFEGTLARHDRFDVVETTTPVLCLVVSHNRDISSTHSTSNTLAAFVRL